MCAQAMASFQPAREDGAPFVCAIGPNTKLKSGRIQCDRCQATCRNWSSLVRHFETAHAVALSSMSGHYICAQAELERTKIYEMSDAEYTYCGAVEDSAMFMCKPCGKTMSKRSALSHFTSDVHRLTMDEVKAWVVHKDSRALKKGCARLCAFSACYKMKERDATANVLAGGADGSLSNITAGRREGWVCEGPSVLPDAGVCVDDGSGIFTEHDGTKWKAMWVKVNDQQQPVGPICAAGFREMCTYSPSLSFTDCQTERTPEASPALQAPPGPLQQGQLQNIQDLLQKVVGSKDIEVQRPSVRLATLTQQWSRSDLKEKNDDGTIVLRKYCPIPDVEKVDLRQFNAYLKRNLGADDSVEGNLLGARRFFNLIDVDMNCATITGTLIALYETDVISSLLSSEIMAADLSWNGKIAVAVDHMAEFSLSECKRLRQVNAQWAIEQFKEVVRYFKKEAQARAKESRKKKARRDAKRIERLAPPKFLKHAVKKAMIELCLLAESFEQDGNCATEAEKAYANVLIVGIVWLNGFAGRSGEWKMATREHFHAQVAAGFQFIECTEHKTAKYYGSLAKHLAPGTIKALQVYTSLPSKTTGLLFEPVRATTKEASVHKALKKFGELFLDGYEALGVNLIRKMFHTNLIQMQREGKCLELLSKVDAHSVHVAIDVYTVPTPQADARLGSILYEQVMGTPTDWPTSTELRHAVRAHRPSLAAITNEPDVESEDEDLASIHDEITQLQIVMTDHGAPANTEGKLSQAAKREQEAKSTTERCAKKIKKGKNSNMDALGVVNERARHREGSETGTRTGDAAPIGDAQESEGADNEFVPQTGMPRKIPPELQACLFDQHFATARGRRQAMNRSWFKEFLEKAIMQRLVSEGDVSAEGLRTLVRKHFKQRGVEPEYSSANAQGTNVKRTPKKSCSGVQVQFVPRAVGEPAYADTTTQQKLCFPSRQIASPAPAAPAYADTSKQMKMQRYAVPATAADSGTASAAAAEASTRRKGRPCPFTVAQQNWLRSQFFGHVPTNKEILVIWLPRAAADGILDVPPSDDKAGTDLLLGRIRAFCRMLERSG